MTIDAETNKGKGLQDWITPPYLFDKLNAHFNFTIDICASEGNAKCKRYYTAHQDALAMPWKDEIIWCNPPYANTLPWVRKGLESARHQGSTCVMLLHAKTETTWFQDYAWQGEVYLLKSRVQFLHPETGKMMNNNRFGSMLLVFDPENVGRFKGEKQMPIRRWSWQVDPFQRVALPTAESLGDPKGIITPLVKKQSVYV
jgi:site-specific DNA-methyltransferase (adenine-specific)